MGIFTRLRDIVTSNINAMLEKAENPEKLLKLMLQEMEDTLIEIKAQCAAAMAQSKTLGRQADEARDRAEQWEAKARLAVEKGRDDLAREALLEKRRYGERADALDVQKTDCDALIEHYQNDIVELEAKMTSVRDKQKVLIQRHEHAQTRRRAQTNIRKADATDVFARFDGFERRIDRMEAEADLVNYGRKPTLEQAFSEIETDEELEAELKRLREESRPRDEAKGGGKPVAG